MKANISLIDRLKYISKSSTTWTVFGNIEFLPPNIILISDTDVKNIDVFMDIYIYIYRYNYILKNKKK